MNKCQFVLRVMSLPSLNTVLGQAEREGLGGLTVTNQDTELEEVALNPALYPFRANYKKSTKYRFLLKSPGPYQSPRSPVNHCDWKLQREQSPNNKHSYRSQNLHLSLLVSKSQPCSHLASVALRALENTPSTGQMLSLAVSLYIEESCFLQGPQWDQAGLKDWVLGANLEEINSWSER